MTISPIASACHTSAELRRYPPLRRAAGLRCADDLVAQVVLLLARDRAGDLGGAPAGDEGALDAEARQDLIAGQGEVLDARGVGQGAGLCGLRELAAPDRGHGEREVARHVVAAAAAGDVGRRGLERRV